jgi:hypothetical protein
MTIFAQRERRSALASFAQLGWSHEMRTPKRILLALLAFLSAVVYVWVAAVRAVPEVKRRKAERRRRPG